MRYILVDGKWHIYEMDGARQESTACGITEWPLDPEWTAHEPEKVCAKCAKAKKAA